MNAAKKIYEQLKRDPPLFKKYGKQIEEFCPQLSLDLASDALELSSTGMLDRTPHSTFPSRASVQVFWLPWSSWCSDGSGFPPSLIYPSASFHLSPTPSFALSLVLSS